MSEKETTQQKSHMFPIGDLKNIKLVSLKRPITEAITEKKQIRVCANSREPTEILKGTYVAKIISKSGYACRVTFPTDGDEMHWICDPTG